MALLMGGMTHLARIHTMAANAISSTTNVPFGTRKLLANGTTWVLTSVSISQSCLPAGMRPCSPAVDYLAENEDEQRHERQVDEEHGLHQTDGEEEDGLETT